MGLSSRRALSKASSPQGYQSTGLWACCCRYGLFSAIRWFSKVSRFWFLVLGVLRAFGGSRPFVRLGDVAPRLLAHFGERRHRDGFFVGSHGRYATAFEVVNLAEAHPGHNASVQVEVMRLGCDVFHVGKRG